MCFRFYKSSSLPGLTDAGPTFTGCSVLSSIAAPSLGTRGWGPGRPASCSLAAPPSTPPLSGPGRDSEGSPGRGTPALRAPAIRPLPPGQAAPVWTVPRGCFAVFHNLPACRGDWEGLWEAGPPAMDRGRLLRGGKGDAKEDAFPPLPQLFPHRAAPTPTGWSLCLSAPASQAPCPRVVCWSSSQHSGKRFTRSRTRVL